MLVYLVLRVISAMTAFLYPTYASYKTLSKRPANESEIERWLMYWAVLGTIVGTEYIAGWVISWIPFYTPLKTLLLLYISLPYTQGSSYIYTKHLHPFLLANETEIDLKVGEVRRQFWEYLSKAGRATLIWIAGVVGVGGGIAGADSGASPGAGSSAGADGGQGGLDSPPFGSQAQMPQPSASATTMMMNAPAQVVLGLWRTYGPQIAALMQQVPEDVPMTTATGQTHQHTSTPLTSTPTSTPTVVRSKTTSQTIPQFTTGTSTAVDKHHDLQLNYAQIIARRRALEAEIAALPPVPTHDPSFSMSAGGAFNTTLTSTSLAGSPSPSSLYHPPFDFTSSLARPPSGDCEKGQYAQSRRDDGDGDEFGDVDIVDDGNDDGNENGGAGVVASSGAGRFWWWGGESSHTTAAGYERVKTE